MPADVFQRFMDYEIMTDFLMSNTDRHMNNIALLRNPDTLEISWLCTDLRLWKSHVLQYSG